MMAEDKRYWSFGGLLGNLSEDDSDIHIIKDYKGRLECYEIAFRIGLLTVDEMRKLERLPELRGEDQ